MYLEEDMLCLMIAKITRLCAFGFVLCMLPHCCSVESPSEKAKSVLLFRLHREMHRALTLLPRRTQQLRETGETGEN